MLAIDIPQIEYRSGATARHVAYALDMHYGSDLYGGRYNGPAVAIVGAIGTVSAGVTLGGFLGGMMIAGGIATGLGALTGNKTLSTLGMGLSLAGGIGAGFTNATTGEFMNPFSEGFKFSDTALGTGVSKIKNFFSDVSGQPASGLADQLSTSGNDIVKSATSGLPTSASNDMGLSLGGSSEVADSVIGSQGVRNAASNVASSVGSSAAGGAKGLLSSLGGTRDIMALAGGLADGYQRGEQIAQNQPFMDAKTDQINAETMLSQNRYNNMQAQPEVGIGVNKDAQIFNKSTGTGKVAVIINNKVQYVTPEQYAQLQQQQQQAQPQGLLATQGGQ